MSDVSTPLSDDEYHRLDQFLLDRIDENADTTDRDEGVLGISELDGLFTAIVSGPVTILPSQWIPAVWGDFEPVWRNKQQVQEICSLMMRHMNAIAGILMESPEAFEPVYLERQVEDHNYTIVDDWCEGYWRGVQLATARWGEAGKEIAALLAPILAFTEKTSWRGHDIGDDQIETLQQAIEHNVRAIHAYWLARRPEQTPITRPVRRSGPRVGRNDPCPCGSGKKYKKCCLQ